MKKFLMLYILVLLVTVSFLFSEVKNQDKPLKGQWDFELKEVWTVDKAGDKPLVKPRHLMVSKDGTNYLYDGKNVEYYTFTKDGKFIKTFAKRGEGPGELKRFYNAFLLKDKHIIADAYEIEYLTKDGKFIKSIKNDFSQRLPDFFISEDEFVYFPLLKLNNPDIDGKIFKYNIKTQTQKLLAEFPVFEGGTVKNEEVVIGVIVPGLSPLMVIGYTPGIIYYGYNSSYVIIAADYSGKKLHSFSLERKKGTVTKGAKEEFFKDKPIPKNFLPTIMKSLPDELTYFSRIEIHNKLIFVYVSYLDQHLANQQIDIFSPDGKYLYRSQVRAPEGFSFTVGRAPIILIQDDHLYTALKKEDGKGKIILAKYKITLPKE